MPLAQSMRPKNPSYVEAKLEQDDGTIYRRESQVRRSIRQRQKSELKSEIDETERSRKCCAAWRTVIRYLLSETMKKPTACKIGVFTVFLVVLVITMLKSVVDSAPILYVKLGQDSVGAIDYTLTTHNNAYKRVPNNLYGINPFEGQFGPYLTSSDDS